MKGIAAQVVPRWILEVSRFEQADVHQTRTRRRLRDKVGRLVEPVTKRHLLNAKPEPEASCDLVFVREEAVTSLIEAWRERRLYLPREVISDPPWAMLLDLLQAEIQGRRTCFSSLCRFCAIPESTTDRWLRVLESHALAFRRADPLHPNDDIVALTQKGSSVMRRYFRDVVQSRDPFEHHC